MDASLRYGPEMRVLVAGGGLAGLSLTAHLRQRGFSPEIIEKGPTVPNDSRNSDCVLIFPPTAGVLKGLGVFREFREHATPIDTLRILDGHGGLVTTVPLRNFMDPYGGGYVATRSRVGAILEKLAAPTRPGVQIEELAQGADDAEVTLSDGSQGRYDIVAGADGLHSHVRELVFGPVKGTFWDGRVWALSLEPPLELGSAFTEVWAPGRFVGAYRAADRTHCILAGPAKADDEDPSAQRRDRVLDLFGELGGPVPEILERLPDGEHIRTELLFDLRLDRWAEGRVVLIGDAAHASIPVIGLGGGASIISGSVLASEITRTDSGHLGAAWGFYTRRRKPRIDLVQDRSRERFSMLSVQHRLMAWTRDEIMRATSHKRLLEGWEEILQQPI